MGPHPFPTIVRDFQSVISREIEHRCWKRKGGSRMWLACVGDGSNAIGTFYDFIDDKDVRLIGCEAAGRGMDTARLQQRWPPEGWDIPWDEILFSSGQVWTDRAGVLYFGRSGLPGDRAGARTSLRYGRAEYVPITDDEAVEAFEYLSRTEGIIPAIESAHAVAYARKLAPAMGKEKIVVINVSGSGDKDCAAIARYRGEDLHE